MKEFGKGLLVMLVEIVAYLVGIVLDVIYNIFVLIFYIFLKPANFNITLAEVSDKIYSLTQTRRVNRNFNNQVVRN